MTRFALALLFLLPCGAPAAAYSDLYNRAEEAHKAGRLAEAGALYSRAAAGALEEKGARQEYGLALTMLAVTEHTRGDLKLAEKHYRLGLAHYRRHKLGGLNVPLSGLGRLYLDRNLPLKAGPLLKESCELQYKEVGATVEIHTLADAIAAMGRLYEQLGRNDKAEVYYLTAVKLFDKDPAFAKPLREGDAEQADSYPIILYRTGLFYRRSGKAADGAGYFARALKAFEGWPGLDDRPVLKARTLDYRSRTLRALGRSPEAEAARKEAARLYKQARQARIKRVEGP